MTTVPVRLQFFNKKTSDFGQAEFWNLFQRAVTVGKLRTKYFSLGLRVKSNGRFNIAVDTSQEKVIWAWWMQPPLLAQIINSSPLWRDKNWSIMGRKTKSSSGRQSRGVAWLTETAWDQTYQTAEGVSVSFVSSGQIRTGQGNDLLLFSQHSSESQFYGHSQKKVRSSQVHRRCSVERKEFCSVWNGNSDESGPRPGHDWEEIRGNKLDKERVGICGGSTQSAEEILKYVSAKHTG